MAQRETSGADQALTLHPLLVPLEGAEALHTHASQSFLLVL